MCVEDLDQLVNIPHELYNLGNMTDLILEMRIAQRWNLDMRGVIHRHLSFSRALTVRLWSALALVALPGFRDQTALYLELPA